MDISPVFELKTRLRAAMIAGTDLLSEDFRLKKAVESFSALAGASPVFAKINALTEKLLSENSPECLLDTITLVDSVITTLGTAEVKGELEELPDNGGTVIVNAPYSRLSAVLEALTSSGGGQLNTILTARKETPEIFSDYRVKPALVQGLGASYAELADTAASILKGMGKEIIPLLKKDFDPKGKKEMVRRLNIIEELCGSEENDFYLEQLENSEKDVRKALIYALRHDERNIGKLIELTKTEKGKIKEAALAALISFDNKKSEEFFNEYGKKKPAEVIAALGKVSSKWTSELTARLIDAALVDENGNKVTLSQAADGKLKLKSKTSFWDMNSALWGKWGADIEKIYREFKCDDKTPIAVGMDMRLEETILVTNDEGLKALARELNTARGTKGIYVGAEAAARLLSPEDSSEWFAKEIIAEKKRHETAAQHLTNYGIARTLRKIFFKDGKYYLINRCYDPINDGWIVDYPREITQSVKGKITDALIKCSHWEFDRILGDWIDPNDAEYREKIGRHFCNNIMSFSGTGFSDISLWCGYIKKCGFKNVKNLAADYFKNIKGKSYTGWVQRVLQDIPGDDKYKLEEARAILEIAKKKKYAWFNIEEFEAWANSSFAHD
ncbi:MAG: hypothetical protein HDT43_13435 [Ruminococcaceae bacterium]|nr:hypothetical protein [Oscillospiraceae bacterium]